MQDTSFARGGGAARVPLSIGQKTGQIYLAMSSKATASSCVSTALDSGWVLVVIWLFATFCDHSAQASVRIDVRVPVVLISMKRLVFGRSTKLRSQTRLLWFHALLAVMSMWGGVSLNSPEAKREVPGRFLFEAKQS